MSLAAVYDLTGVYVLWSGKSKAVPSYIGEGNILNRFNSHMRASWAARPIDGVVALVDAPTQTKEKAFSELAEAALLLVADSIGRYPTHNVSPGKASSALKKILARQDKTIKTIRIVVTGRDPLRPPSLSPMRSEKWIVLRESREGWYVDDFHWNNRS